MIILFRPQIKLSQYGDRNPFGTGEHQRRRLAAQYGDNLYRLLNVLLVT